MTDISVIKLTVGDTVILKKKHPCASNEFSVNRLGSDVRVICNKCKRDLTFPRETFEKIIKKVLPR